MEFNVFEELLEIISMYDTTKGENVFVSVCELLKIYDFFILYLCKING